MTDPPVPGDAPVITTVVREADAGERLDRFLTAQGADLVAGHRGLQPPSRATFQRWLSEGRVTVDDRPARASDKVRAGARVRVEMAPPPPSEVVPQDIPLDIVFEDEHLVVVHKPAGLVVHPAAGHPDGTLVNALRFHVALPAASDPTRPGIVHRLDRDTSGVMVVAKTDRAREGLIARFKLHDIERAYLAIVHGVLPHPVTYEGLHGRHPSDRKRFTGRVEQGKRAVTHVRPLQMFADATLVECTLETGRTHQIRVHVSEGGHPILADPIYGRSARTPRLRAASQAIGRLALHARLLGFRHPVSGQPVRFERAPPEDFAEALSALMDAG